MNIDRWQDDADDGRMIEITGYLLEQERGS